MEENINTRENYIQVPRFWTRGLPQSQQKSCCDNLNMGGFWESNHDTLAWVIFYGQNGTRTWFIPWGMECDLEASPGNFSM